MACWLAGCGALFGQGLNPVVMQTGSGASLSSQSVSYTSTVPGLGAPMLNIDFGFATDEQPQPGFIPDSFTISITGPDGTSYLMTLDAAGAHWTPAVPGALPVNTASLQWQTSPFLVPTQGLTNLASYALGYALPANWQGVPLSVNFDLFDNQNGVPSLGYFSLPVPEPSPAALLVLAFLLSRLARPACARTLPRSVSSRRVLSAATRRHLFCDGANMRPNARRRVDTSWQ